MPEIRRSWLPWRRRAAAVKARPLLERGALPWLLSVAIATTAPHAEFLPWWLSALCAAALAGRAWLWLKNGRLPRRWLLAMVVIAGTIGIGWQYRSLFGRDPGIALLVFFMALKPMEMSARRDGLVVIMLGFFLLLTHYFHAEDIVTGAWLLVSATLLTATLLRMYGGAQPARRIFRHAGLLIAQSLPFMLILFVLFPRVEGPLWGMPRDAYAGLSGLASQMSPGSLDDLVLSGAVAFRVQFDAGAPDQRLLYWRGPAFDSYDGRTWRTSFASTPAARRGPAVIEADEASTVDYTITLEAHNRRWLLALDLPLVLPGEAALAPSLEVLANRPVRYRARFDFRSATNYTANREEDPRLLQQARNVLARLNPRSRELAETWRREFDDPEKISAAALRLFREEKFFYTLKPPLLGANAIDEFLFGTRRGFCEHYASAYVVLMRAAGIPARVVTGYQGGELKPVDGTLTVRQSDAHAWAEIWLEGKGWRRVDPTAAVAPSRIEKGIDAALPEDEPLPALVRFEGGWLVHLRSLRYRWEAVNNAWDQWVLGYNSERQREALARLGMQDANWQSMFLTMMAASGLLLALIVCRMLFRRVRIAPEARLWHRFCARLAGFGIRRAPWEGPLDLAARTEREAPELAPLVRRAAEHFAELRYGDGRPEHFQALRDCAKELASFRKC
jgi:transglutaminase-like putative cysteine protease